MAKRTATKNTRKPRRTRNIEEFKDMEDSNMSGSRSSRGQSRAMDFSHEDRDYREILREIVSSPAVRYIAGGIATALITRLANNLSERYPEISNFIRENMDNLEGRFGEYRSGLDKDTLSSRH